MRTMLTMAVAALWLTGVTALVLAEDAITGETNQMNADIKAEKEAMKADTKAKKAEMKRLKKEHKKQTQGQEAGDERKEEGEQEQDEGAEGCHEDAGPGSESCRSGHETSRSGSSRATSSWRTDSLGQPTDQATTMSRLEGPNRLSSRYRRLVQRTRR